MEEYPCTKSRAGPLIICMPFDLSFAVHVKIHQHLGKMSAEAAQNCYGLYPGQKN